LSFIIVKKFKTRQLIALTEGSFSPLGMLWNAVNMIVVTKIFRFEMAHAILGYNGKCKNIHGHSYELHATVSSQQPAEKYFPSPGFVIDFKDLKKIVNAHVIDRMDHKLLLSKEYIAERCKDLQFENLVIFEAEPTAENLLVFIAEKLQQVLPAVTKLRKLKLYETEDSYAEWLSD
jgi:6-pyruvoyltetrahydropterin/6-carboxytetrahydropterin synthase